ncbi:glycoside hydrolase family 15 protein [Streptomyces sp. ISL-98]|uniref:glycoside hydrolase family 15 protein n=1 Tax=Streptomyces sp. ISL-98 TaxID=2819192 RepID=UPI001BEA1C78|nr:glycoside hydrolase family 15 protein [Streptomyces sp. ISL-98]MBT2507642.1 glycoside hydrolase family 15 protein [Streptomyces sp. ISL-98]
MGSIRGSPGIDRRPPTTASRTGGYVPLSDYAVIGDGRAAALVARDGSVDWLGLPDLDSPALFGAVLDATDGGRFLLEPAVPYRTERRYLPGTNVLETTFFTMQGTVRVTDALTLQDDTMLAPMRELQRHINGLSGSVPMRWSVQPRFRYGTRAMRLVRRGGVPVATAGRQALAVCAWDAGEPRCERDSVVGSFQLASGGHALIAMPFADQEPLVLPTRSECDMRLEHTCAAWRQWAHERIYAGRWQEAVMRSLLTLKMLVFAPSGAVAAAATTSLPERIGGERNWDYRFSWVRDSAFTLAAFLQSKMMCWVALDRATDLAERRLIPDRHLARWRSARMEIATFVETRCASPRRNCYVRSAGSEDLDAAVLLGHLYGYGGNGERMRGTITAVREELVHGPYVDRYSGEDGLSGGEGAFVACSFWLAESLARAGDVRQAIGLMDDLVDLANDVGLYSEEIDPATGSFLGNLPQGLSHLALISAACAISTAGTLAGA